VGRKLAQARRAAGLSQEALARLVGVSKATISMIECGLRMPKVDLLVRLAAALSVPPETLLPDVPETRPAASGE
jgi:transcriptional regulator with XRE-family HTH domain